jgi:vancomycin resistance protein VanJ
MTERRWRSLFTLSRVSLAAWVIGALGLVIMDRAAEALLPFWILLFVPPVILIIPFLVLGLLAAVRRQWRLLGGHFLAVLIVLFGFFRYRLASAPSAVGESLAIVTHNIGQGNKLSFTNAFPGVSPDAILLQDAPYRERDYARRYPQLRGRGVAQFLLLTPHEIVEGAQVNEALWRGRPVAARYVIRVKGREIALYNVHLPTPRRSLRHALSPKVALEMVWLADAPTDDHPSYRSWLSARVTLAQKLSEVFSREPLPFVVTGDFNTPDHGKVYRSISEGLQDSHVVAGNGWGWTFPGDGRKDGRLALLFGPWLRLDYIFAGKGLAPVECRVASDDGSQHRAVFARLALLP